MWRTAGPSLLPMSRVTAARTSASAPLSASLLAGRCAPAFAAPTSHRRGSRRRTGLRAALHHARDGHRQASARGRQADRIVETLKGADATRAKVEAALSQIAGQAKAQDAFVLMMIGHGTFDGAEYKFNLPGPDISGAGTGGADEPHSRGRQLVVDMTSASGGAVRALEERQPHRDYRDQIRHGKERHRLRAVSGWKRCAIRRRMSTRTKSISALEAFQYAREEDRRVLFRTEAPGDGASAGGRSAAASAFPLFEVRSASAVVTDPAKRELIAKKEEIENKIDALKYQKSLMAPDDYKKQLTALLIELAKAQEAIDK